MMHFIRHGQTDWNVLGKIQGITNTPLNETGRQQAREAKDALANIEFDMCLSSPLDRAKDTAEIIFGTEIQTDERLVERNFGEYEGTSEPREVFLPKFWASYDSKEYNSESINEARARLTSFMDEIKSRFPDKKILVVSHGGLLYVLQGLLLDKEGWDGDHTKLEYIKNCQVIEVE